MITTTDRYAAASGAVLQIGMLADRLSGIVLRIAPPSLVQLVLRFGLAVPFWRSGILKWDGFLQLNNTAVGGSSHQGWTRHRVRRNRCTCANRP